MISVARSVLLLGALRRRRGRIPRQLPTRAIEREYARRIELYVDAARAALRPLLDALPRLVTSRQDAGEGDEARRLADTARARLAQAVTTEEIESLAREFGRRTATHQRLQLNKQVRAALGVDVVASDATIAPLAANFVAENVSLIR